MPELTLDSINRKLNAVLQEIDDLRALQGETGVMLRGEGNFGAVLDSPTLAAPLLQTGTSFDFNIIGTEPTGAEQTTQVLPSVETEDAGIAFRGSLSTQAGAQDWIVGVTNIGRFAIVADENLADPRGLFLFADGTLRIRATAGGTLATIPSSSTIFSDAEGDPAAVVPDTAADGTSTFAARRDHVHGITDRTRHIPLIPEWNATISSATPAIDAHGSLTAHMHFDCAAATDDVLWYNAVLPADYVTGDLTFKVAWSNTVGSNAWRRNISVVAISDGDTAFTMLENTGTNITVTAADTIAFSSQAVNDAQATAGDVLGVRFGRIGTNAGDTNTGITSIWAAWLEYTADS